MIIVELSIIQKSSYAKGCTEHDFAKAEAVATLQTKCFSMNDEHYYKAILFQEVYQSDIGC